MAIDTPATIAVLGAGPVGLEAALYARYLGYAVDIYERGRVAEHLRAWSHLPLFTPFGMNRSNLGVAALKAQDTHWRPPSDDALLTAADYLDRYLLPLAQSDLLVDHLHERTEVLAVGREGLYKGDLAGDETRGDGLFRIVLRSTNEFGHVTESIATADVVIDATGRLGTPGFIGHGGVPAIGELAARPHFHTAAPDVLGVDRHDYAGRNILLVGQGPLAAANAIALAELARQSPNTWVTWLTREPASPQGPVLCVDDDPFPQRARRCRLANELALDDSNHITWWPATAIEAVDWHADLARFSVRTSGQFVESLQVDRVIANASYSGDYRMLSELQFAEDAATGAPRDYSAARAASSTDWPAAALINLEPHLYVLGAKSFGRDPSFLIADGLRQIQKLFTIIGDRESLDLYASVVNLIG